MTPLYTTAEYAAALFALVPFLVCTFGALVALAVIGRALGWWRW